MKTIVSVGLGRLHLIQTAQRLADAGVCVRLICGWVPKRADSWLVKMASRIVGRDLSAGMRKRLVNAPGLQIGTCFCAEAFAQIVRRISKRARWVGRLLGGADWPLFGFQSRMYIRDADVFHVRSGAGQGGAIAQARRKGMKILVDHSCLHPAACLRNLEADYGRWGRRIPIRPSERGVWACVEQDCKDADLIMVNADHIKKSFVEQGYDPDKIRVNYLGVREDFWSLKTCYRKEGCFTVLFTGNFQILKGAEYILESLRILVEQGADVKYEIVGEVVIPDELKIRYEGLPITYHGAIPQDDLKRFLSESDLYLFPSLADGCASSGMEALAAGLPVVATVTSGLPIKDGVTGMIVPSRDAEAIVSKIKWAMAHPNEVEWMGRTAAKMMQEKYTWPKYAMNVVKIYRELLAE